MITKEKIKQEIDNIPENTLEDIYRYIITSKQSVKTTFRHLHTYKLKGQYDTLDIRGKAYE